MNKILYFSIFLCLLLNASHLPGQSNATIWSPVGTIESKYTVINLESRGNDLYAGLYSTTDSLSFIAKWNGLFWSYYPPIKGILQEKHTFEIYNDSLFVLYLDNSGGSSKFKIAKLNGKVWQNIPAKFTVLSDTFYHQLACIKNVNNTLYLFGYILDSTGTEAGIMKYQNGSWVTEGPKGIPGVQGLINDISSYNGMLMLHGSLMRKTKARSDVTKLSVNLIWNGINWQTHDNYVDSNQVVCNDHDTLYVVKSNVLMKFYSNINVNITGNLVYPSVIAFVPIQNKYYLYGTVSINGGTSWITGLLRRNGGNWVLLELATRDKIIDFNGRLASPSQNISRKVEILNPGLSYITGNIFKDANNNCLKDGTEENITARKITILPDKYSVTCDNSGNYFVTVSPGTKTVSTSALFNSKYLTVAPCTSAIKTISVGADSIVNVDFPMVEQARTDIGVKIIPLGGNRIRKNGTDFVTVNVGNMGTTEFVSGTLKLKLDPRLSIQWSTPTYASFSNNIVTWNFTNLKKNDIQNFLVSFQLASSTNPGDSLQYTAWVTPDTDDDSSDNMDSTKCYVVYSYDPNDKQCTPPNVILATTDQLVYTIRFQNTGTSYAQNVYVVDTLDNNLPLEKIEIAGWSTPVRPRVEVRGGNIIVFTFANILLPDSFSNEKESHGYVYYRCGLYKNLPLGAKITNRADIYFDYNKAIPTNTTENTQVEKVGIDILNHTSLNDDVDVYPNPAGNELFIRSHTFEMNSIAVTDLAGKLLISKRTEGIKAISIETGEFADGIYLIRLDNDTDHTVKKIVICH